MSALFYDGVDHMIEKITTLIKGKANNSHKHTKNDITDFPTLGTASSKDVASSGNASATQVVMGNDTRLSDARKASDVSAWAKASTKPTYTASEVGAYTKTETDTKLNGKANSSHTHGNGDITSLDAGKITSGTISIDRLPQGALDRLIKVVNDTARFKLTTKDVQLGDSVKVTSTKKMYIVVDETKLSSEDGYEPYTADSATSVPWSGVTGKPSTYTPSSHTHTKSQITDFPTSMPASDVSAWAKASSKPSYSKSEVGLGNVDNTADSAKSVKYATSAGSASSASKATEVVDYGATTNTIQIGYSGKGATTDNLTHIAGYIENGTRIKDVSKDTLKLWLGLGSLAYSSATIPTIPSSLPANGGNASTVNGHTVESNVPANAKFTDTIYDDTKVKEDINALNKETTVNLLPASSSTSTKNGVTFTGNGDGTYTLTGTATDEANFVICSNIIRDISNKLPLKLLGGISNNVYVAYVNTFDDNKSIADKGTGGVIINDANNSLLCITVLAGETLPNIVIKPMLTTNLNATYDDFVPYTGDSGSLNGDVAYLSKRINALKKSASYESGTFTGTLFNDRSIELASATGFYKKVETMVYIYVAVINNVGSTPVGLKGLPFNTLGGLSLNNKSELFAYDSEKKQIIRPNQISNSNQVLFDSGVLSMESCVELWGWYRI